METSLGHKEYLIFLYEVTDNFPGIVIDHACSQRNADDDVLTGRTGTVGRTAVLASSGHVKLLKLKVYQSINTGIGSHVHVTAITAVTAVRASLRDKFFSSKAYDTVTAVTGFDTNFSFINEFHYDIFLSVNPLNMINQQKKRLHLNT